jgi:hypothetical protein
MQSQQKLWNHSAGEAGEKSGITQPAAGKSPGITQLERLMKDEIRGVVVNA